MLQGYHRNISIYQELWAKYGQKVPHGRGTDAITSQEEAIRWSLKLKEAINAIALERQVTSESVLSAFLEGVASAGLQDNKLKAGLAKIGNPEEIIERWHLFFLFNSVDDLFLEDENDGKGVMIIE